MAKSTGLGRGFSSLLPQDVTTSVLIEPGEKVQQIKLDNISPNSDQPRTHFDDSLLRELADSITVHGVVQPIVVTPKGKGYEIVAGERRWRASRLAGQKTIPALVRSVEKLNQLEVALIENVQRVDLSPLEQAYSIQRLREQFNIPLDDVAKRLGKASSTVNNIVRLVQLPEKAKTALLDKNISEGHARQILALKDDPTAQETLLNLITKNSWSVRMSENYVTSLKEGTKETTKAVARIQKETPETKALSKRLGRPVTIRRSAKGGRLEIGFTDDSELSQLIRDLKI